MSLEVGRVGVRPDQLDNYGRINPKSQFIQNLLNDLPAWTDLPVWKKGTEQLLPVNDDEPDTSPILCDIEYPVADLKNNQYFTYRQSPTQKDGKAKIRGIRGKTIVWNQLQRNNAETQTVNEMVFTNNGDGSWKVNGTCTQFTQKSVGLTYAQGVVGHKYLFMGCPKMTLPDGVSLRPYINGAAAAAADRDYGDGKVLECTVAGSIYCLITISNANTTLNNVVFHPMIIDLTLLGITTVTDKASFQQLFPLPSYAFNLGSLLDFTGTKVKTVGFNQVESFSNGSVATQYSNALYIKGDLLPNTEYCLSVVAADGLKYYRNEALFSDVGVTLTGDGTRQKLVLHTKADISKANGTQYVANTGWRVLKCGTGNTVIPSFTDVCLNISDTSKNGTYEAYESNETDLPISTFFPTGMKSAGAVYDELTPTRAITRVGQVDLGATKTSDWTKSGGVTNCFILINLSDIKGVSSSTVGNLTCNAFATKSYDNLYAGDDGISNRSSSGKGIAIKSSALSTYYSNNNIAGLITYLNGVKVNYELAAEDVQPTMSFGD